MISETYNMDCMDYMRSVPKHFFDLAIVDPPYGIGRSSMGEKKKWKSYNPKDWDNAPPDRKYFEELSAFPKTRSYSEEIISRHIYLQAWDGLFGIRDRN